MAAAWEQVLLDWSQRHAEAAHDEQQLLSLLQLRRTFADGVARARAVADGGGDRGALDDVIAALAAVDERIDCLQSRRDEWHRTAAAARPLLETVAARLLQCRDGAMLTASAPRTQSV